MLMLNLVIGHKGQQGITDLNTSHVNVKCGAKHKKGDILLEFKYISC